MELEFEIVNDQVYFNGKDKTLNLYKFFTDYIKSKMNLTTDQCNTIIYNVLYSYKSKPEFTATVYGGMLNIYLHRLEGENPSDFIKRVLIEIKERIIEEMKKYEDKKSYKIDIGE